MNGSDSTHGAPTQAAINAAREIIKRDRANRQITNGCIEQIIHDITRGDRDYKKFLLYAAEALDRATGGGDSYFKRLEYYITKAEFKGQTPPA